MMAQTSFHPGEHLQEELDELLLSPEAFASRLGVSVESLSAVLEGRQSVTAEFALRLGHFFGTSAQFWLNLQSSFDLEQAQRLHGAEIEALPTLQAA
jgi:addiction module HigA family antidote